MINTEKRNYAIGIGAGVGIGAGLGVASKSKLAGSKLIREAKTVKSIYLESLEDFKYDKLDKDTLTKLGSIQKTAREDSRVSELFERALDNTDVGNKQPMDKFMKALKKKENKLLSLPENKDVKEAIEDVTKQFNETKGKESFDKLTKLNKEIKNKQIKGIVGLAVAGLAIGAIATTAVNKVKNNTKNTNSINIKA